MIKKDIEEFAGQLSFNPEIVWKEKLKPAERFLVCGMGGSHLAADIVNSCDEKIEVHVHSDYGLPRWKKELFEKCRIIISSYSGNTEEAIDSFGAALEAGYDLAVLSSGGQLLELAKKHNVPYVALPARDIQPRIAVGYSFVGLLALIENQQLQKEAREAGGVINPKDFEQWGGELAQKMKGKIPVIYGSAKNFAIAYNWKIKLNETGKIPAFYNVIPELNHNEMNGLDRAGETQTLSEAFFFIFLHDDHDHPRIIKRMDILGSLFTARRFPVEHVRIETGSVVEKIFSFLILADWVSLQCAQIYGVEAEPVPMVEEFKKLMLD
jgi:glucose/mannose-6-phosphate isomerase